MNEIPLEPDDLRLLLRITGNLQLTYLVDDPATILATIKQEIAKSTIDRGLAGTDDPQEQQEQLNRLSARIRRALGEPVDETGHTLPTDS
ncbi:MULTISPECIES: hypothetical protein [unclassified Leifsonia]|uniref:hypothetical protein n=1 Tax=unclassified Leifsonia TaxID=2663824 RepID=UPI0008A7452E|nr:MULTISPECIES: hypothetical protein [unclassified Leifsonia]SEH96319.1 hypothetical protein SAMN04515694_1082 [Leifsonia sp. CL154]SFL64604.1 hypothetical protein SAMN04515692_108134 [Leifsonia sp. CL147]